MRKSRLAVRIPSNYLDYMFSRQPFKGVHNARKVKILYSVAKWGPLPVYKVNMYAGAGCTYSCIRSTVSRLVKYGYLVAHDGKYDLLAKGKRYFYAASKLAPEYKSWATEVEGRQWTSRLA